MSAGYVDAKIKDKTVRCLLDTGSDETLVPYSLVKKHRFTLCKARVDKLKAANGSDILIAGQVTIPLEIAENQIETKALVSKDLT